MFSTRSGQSGMDVVPEACCRRLRRPATNGIPGWFSLKRDDERAE